MSIQLKAIPSRESSIALPDYICAACSDALAYYCTEHEIANEKAVRDLAAFAEDVAQRIHLAMIQQQQAEGRL